VAYYSNGPTNTKNACTSVVTSLEEKHVQLRLLLAWIQAAVFLLLLSCLSGSSCLSG
jgi:hypothetical protein